MEGLKQQNSRINAVQALLALVNAVLLIGGVMLALRVLWGPRAPVMLLPALAVIVLGLTMLRPRLDDAFPKPGKKQEVRV